MKGRYRAEDVSREKEVTMTIYSKRDFLKLSLYENRSQIISKTVQIYMF